MFLVLAENVSPRDSAADSGWRLCFFPFDGVWEEGRMEDEMEQPGGGD